MDTELARTFLTVVTAGNFIAAAERLHVSQSTVSTRIHTLEQQLGCTLFVRNKAGATLTPAGRQFQRHASALVRTVEQARQDVGIPKGFSGTLVVGGRIGLWEEYLLRWLPLMQAANPEILDPGRKRARAGDHARAGGRAHRYRRDVHAAKPPGSQGRAVVRGAAHSGVDRSEKRARAATWLCLCRLGPGILCPPQRVLPEFRGSVADGEYRLARIAARAGQWRLRIFRAPDRGAAVEDEAASRGRRRAGIFDAGLCRLSARPAGRSRVERHRNHASNCRCAQGRRRRRAIGANAARASGVDRRCLRIDLDDRSNRHSSLVNAVTRVQTNVMDQSRDGR